MDGNQSLVPTCRLSIILILSQQMPASQLVQSHTQNAQVTFFYLIRPENRKSADPVTYIGTCYQYLLNSPIGK